VLSDANPQIVLEARPRRRRCPLWDRELDYRLTRRVIEIRDGELALRRYTDPLWQEMLCAFHAKRGLDEPQLAAVVQAGILRNALAAQVEDSAICTRETMSNACTDHDLLPADGAGTLLDEEITWLLLVADAFVDGFFEPVDHCRAFSVRE
jgi:hypothetical protein